MAAKQVTGDGVPSSLAGMSKNQLYDIMSQMKTLIEQNKQQAKQVLIQNPALTKALFQAQIMLGMVQPPQAAPAPVNPQPQMQNQQPNVQGTSQVRKQQTNIPMVPSQANLGAPSTTISIPQLPQVPNQIPSHIASQQSSLLQPLPQISSQSQQTMQNTAGQFLPLQPSLQNPLPPQPRPPMPGFPHQAHAQTGPNIGGLQHGGPQLHHPQNIFHPGTKAPGILGSYPQGQPLLPNQLLNQPIYQSGNPHLGMEFNNQAGLPKPTDRGSNWPPGLGESNTGQLPAPPLFGGQAGPSNPPARPAPMSKEMEQALLQQLMSLTPEQISILPADQRNQIYQLQQILSKK